VALDQVEIELTSGKGTLRGLTVGNPAGFKSAQALSLAELSLALDTASVRTDTIVVKEIAITAPEVTYEFGLKGSNLDTLKSNVDAYTEQGKDKKKPEDAKSEAAGPKLIIENLYVRNGKVNVTAPDFQNQTASASLPNIHLTGLGKKTGGATAAEVAEQVLAAISQQAARAAATTNLGGMIDKAKSDAAGALGGAAKEAVLGLEGWFGK
jgi:hypothetical protein